MFKMFCMMFVITGYFGVMQSNLTAQSFGFGCLGLVGGYGGYSYQVYKPAGLNNFVESYNLLRTDSLSQPMSSFGSGKGFRVGLNLFRANLDGLILTAKGFYQLLYETNGSRIESDFGSTSGEFELRIKSWGIGFDLGTSITKAVSWKVIDAALLFNTLGFNITHNYPGARTEVIEYNSDTKVGYSVGTGFILSVIDQYISLEGLVAYSVITIDNVTMSDGSPLLANENSQAPVTGFIEGGGFNAVIQLNLGFPL